MKNSLLAVAAGMVWVLSIPVPVSAQQAACPQDCPCAYLRDNEGQHVKNSFGECWQSSFWRPECRTVECGCVLAAAPPPRIERVAEKITISADALFAFDKATLRPEGMERLDEVAAHAKEFRDIEQINVTAYADPIGNDRYNQRLSERRANAVRNYLVGKGLPSDRVSAKGMGETNQFAKCEGVRGRKNLIACYQPNRRAEIEIVGTKESR